MDHFGVGGDEGAGEVLLGGLETVWAAGFGVGSLTLSGLATEGLLLGLFSLMLSLMLRLDGSIAGTRLDDDSLFNGLLSSFSDSSLKRLLSNLHHRL